MLTWYIKYSSHKVTEIAFHISLQTGQQFSYLPVDIGKIHNSIKFYSVFLVSHNTIHFNVHLIEKLDFN